MSVCTITPQTKPHLAIVLHLWHISILAYLNFTWPYWSFIFNIISQVVSYITQATSLPIFIFPWPSIIGLQSQTGQTDGQTGVQCTIQQPHLEGHIKWRKITRRHNAVDQTWWLVRAGRGLVSLSNEDWPTCEANFFTMESCPFFTAKS